jgi:hypothetical protein
MTPPRGKRHQSAAVIRSTDLGFPPEVAERGLELLHGDAFKKVTTQKSAAIAGLGNKPRTRFSPGSEAESNPYMPSGKAWVGPDAVMSNLKLQEAMR